MDTMGIIFGESINVALNLSRFQSSIPPCTTPAPIMGVGGNVGRLSFSRTEIKKKNLPG